MKRAGIRLRILLAMMAVIGGLLIVTSWVMDGLVNRFLDAEITSSLTLGRKAYTSFSGVQNAVLLDQARSLAQVPHLRAVLDTPDVDAQTMRYTLSTLNEASGAALIFVADAHGRVIADTREDVAHVHDAERGTIDISREPGMDRALRGEDYCGIWNYAGMSYLMAVSPVTLDSSVLGLLGLGHPIEKHVEDLHSVTGLDVTAITGDRVLAASWAPSASETPGSESTLPISRASAWSSVDNEEHARLTIDGREYMATAMALEPDSVRLILSRPLDFVLVHFQRAKSDVLLVGLGIAVLGLIVSQWISNRIARPIRSLTDAANALARGELSQEVPVSGEDEVGVLGRAFNDMARQLEALMQKAMQKAQAAEQANEAKSAFLATMSHEIRTPLNGVLGFTEHLLESELDAEQREHALIVRQSGKDLLAIIEEVLDFAKIESGQLALEEVDFHLATCLRHAIDPVQPAIRAKKIELTLDLDPTLPAHFRGPASRMRQIVLNYVANAVKFTASGSVHVQASLVHDEPTHATVKIEVRDTGIGMARDRLDRLFKPFSQLDSGANREYGGTGLGLAICKDLARLMHGDVGVTSELGIGSTFWFTAKLAKRGAGDASSASDGPKDGSSDAPERAIESTAELTSASSFESAAATASTPISAAVWSKAGAVRSDRDSSLGVPPSPASALPSAKSGETARPLGTLSSTAFRGAGTKLDDRIASRRAAQPILVAEDNPVNQKMAGVVLKKAGWPHEFAENGARAVELAKTGRFALILMDCQMPTMDGLEATRKIRESEHTSSSRIPIIAVTANAFESDKAACFAAGMDGFVGKPFKPSDLEAAIERALASKQSV